MPPWQCGHERGRNLLKYRQVSSLRLIAGYMMRAGQNCWTLILKGDIFSGLFSWKCHLNSKQDCKNKTAEFIYYILIYLSFMYVFIYFEKCAILLHVFVNIVCFCDFCCHKLIWFLFFIHSCSLVCSFQLIKNIWVGFMFIRSLPVS